MSREEAIEILSDMRAEYNIFGDEEEATRYHVLSWAIQEMKAAQQWIPTSERFPEDYIQCLVTVKNCYGFPYIKMCYYGEVEGREYFHDYDTEYGFWEIENVTAWMPLPEPWRGGEDETD